MGTEDTQHACTLERRAAFSMGRFLLSVLGTFLFWNAPGLSASTPFRLTGGTLGFMACSVLIFLFVLYRQVRCAMYCAVLCFVVLYRAALCYALKLAPACSCCLPLLAQPRAVHCASLRCRQLPHKRSLAVGTALFGSSLLGAVRYLFGTWLPSASQLARSPVRVRLSCGGLSCRPARTHVTEALTFAEARMQPPSLHWCGAPAPALVAAAAIALVLAPARPRTHPLPPPFLQCSGCMPTWCSQGCWAWR